MKDLIDWLGQLLVLLLLLLSIGIISLFVAGAFGCAIAIAVEGYEAIRPPKKRGAK